MKRLWDWLVLDSPDWAVLLGFAALFVVTFSMLGLLLT
jgi:hypothetical protein